MYAVFAELYLTAYVGPFASMEEVEAHLEFCRARGDAAEYRGTVPVPPEDPMLLLTPGEDRAWVPPRIV